MDDFEEAHEQGADVTLFAVGFVVVFVVILVLLLIMGAAATTI